MNKKGFTLIELLAVIIILAVIALIATPVVLNVVENARREAAENSAYGIIDAAKYQYIESMLTSTVVSSGNAADLNVSGTPATSGTWKVNTTGTDGTPVITITNVKIGDYLCNTKKDSTSGEVECIKSITVTGTVTGGTVSKSAINGVLIPAS